jgi:hypothetical protein
MCDNFNLRLALRVILTSNVEELIASDPLTLDAKQIGVLYAHSRNYACRQIWPAANGQLR